MGGPLSLIHSESIRNVEFERSWKVVWQQQFEQDIVSNLSAHGRPTELDRLLWTGLDRNEALI